MKNKIKLAVFFIARMFGLFALCRSLSASKVRILCYHGGCLQDESRYNPKLFCSAATLAARMQWLERKGFKLVTLDAATQLASSTGPRPALTTAITFDDGWYSTASELIPVLGKRGIPSTLYLCTSHYLEGWAIASVAVRYLIWKSGLQSAQVHGLGPHGDADYDLSTPAARNRAADRIVRAIDSAPPSKERRHALLNQLAVCLEVPPAQLALESRRFEYMNERELLALPAQGCSIELHGHVHSYPAGDPTAFANDLLQCSAAIVGAGLPAPAHYCYPSGNFDAGASATLSRLGVRSATTCLPGLIGRVDQVQRHYLPRFLDGESVSMLEFQAEMSGFSALIRRVAR